MGNQAQAEREQPKLINLGEVDVGHFDCRLVSAKMKHDSKEKFPSPAWLV